MTNNDDLALKIKEAAEKAIPALEKLDSVTSDEIFDAVSFGVEEQIDIANDYTLIANPANILALLAERDADKKLIAALEKKEIFLKERLAQLANFNPDWDMLEAATDSLREHAAELKSANQRIAALEARTVSVKWPDDGMDDCYDLWGAEHCRDNFDCGYNFSAVRHEQAIREALAVAGINLEVGE